MRFMNMQDNVEKSDVQGAGLHKLYGLAKNGKNWIKMTYNGAKVYLRAGELLLLLPSLMYSGIPRINVELGHERILDAKSTH